MFDCINITGFQAFGNVEVNPTQLIINTLKQKPHPKLRTIQKLNVTVKDVDAYINHLASTCSPKQGRILNLHLGVGPNHIYNLEAYCYNNKTFRIPDNNGYQCQNQTICGNMALDQPLCTKIDLNKIIKELAKRGHKAQISHDPGRYICNYIYFTSLQKMCGENCTSLFVHFPGLEITDMDENLKFIYDLIDIFTNKEYA